MKEEKINKLLKIAFGVFIIIQPFLDVYFLYTEEVIRIFRFSPSTLIRFAFIGIMFIFMLAKYRKNKKILPLLGYIILSIVYAGLHHIFVKNFNSYDPNNFGYSTFKELFYIARLIIPVILMFIVVDFKFAFQDLEKYLCVVACIVGSVIVFANLFKIGLGSYTNEIIKDNIFGWFTGAYNQYSFYELASKGWFNFANQISALLIMLSTITIYRLIKKMSIYNVYNVVVILLSMVMLGTKVALYGAFLSIGMIIAIALVYLVLERKVIQFSKFSIFVMLVLLIGYVCLMKVSPANNRAQINNYIAENREKPKKDDDEEDDEKSIETLYEELAVVKNGSYEEKIEFIEENYARFSIADMFIIDSYSYKIDPDFWLNEFERPLEERLDYRHLEEEMIKRVVEINGNSNSKWFGISYMRVQNIFNIERDFILQYYTIGTVGLVLFIVLPFIILPIIMGLYMLKKHKELLTPENMLLLAMIVLTIGIAFFSGNVIDSLIITIYLAFIIGVLANETIFKKNNEEVNLLDKSQE